MSATLADARADLGVTGPNRASAVYAGTIRHRRTVPRSGFRHRIALAYLDLDELGGLLGGRLVAPGPGLLRFRRADYLGAGGGDPDLAGAVRDRVAELTGARPAGPIRLLTQLRTFGLCFNPVSFYYCFDAAGHHPEHLLAEVTNTPWGERHSYLLASARDGSPVLRGTNAKQLHVSPFFGMDHVYEARATAPGETLSVHIANVHREEVVFDATLALRRAPLDAAGARRLARAVPPSSARVLAMIYGHALALKLHGARYHPHPSQRSPRGPR